MLELGLHMARPYMTHPSGFKRSILRDVLTRSVTHHREAKPGEESYTDVSVDVGAPPLVPDESIVSCVGLQA